MSELGGGFNEKDDDLNVCPTQGKLLCVHVCAHTYSWNNS